MSNPTPSGVHPMTPELEIDSEPWFGCFTGDCPHDTQAQCDAAIRAEFARMERVEHRLEVGVATREGAAAPQPMMTVNGFPRRNRMDLWTEAEAAIQHAVDVCERSLPADVLETDAIILLGKAREKVADLVEREIAPGRMSMPSALPASSSTREGTDAEALAKRFHEAYERLAPKYGYETREASAVPWNDVPDANRALMIATCAEVLGALPSSRALSEEAPTFLHAGDDRVWCVGCTRWCATEGYCEGDPDICPIGEEDQGRSPTLDEAQQAVDALWKELREIDDMGASRVLTEEERQWVRQLDEDFADYPVGVVPRLCRIIDRLSGAPK